MSLIYRISCLVFGTAIVATVLLTCLGYSAARYRYYQALDRQLNSVAALLPRAISQDYLDRALAGDSLPAGEYDAMVEVLNRLADDAGVYYVYVFTQQGEAVVHLATSASQQERTGQDWPPFRAPYEEVPAPLLATFADGQTRFAEYTDEFGDFRSIFIRHTAAAGQHYVVGVDISLAQIHRELTALVWRYLLAGGVVSLVAGGIGLVVARRIAHPLTKLSHEITAWSERDFTRDEAVRTQLKQLAGQGGAEVGGLARNYLAVQDRMENYLERLTETTAAKHKIENELAMAQAIQEGLLPRTVPRIANFAVTGWSQAAGRTGGDYFDWLELPEDRLIVTLGDVMGHGIGPALLASASRAYARATLNGDDELDYTMTRLNALLHADMHDERFITMVACLLDGPSRRLKLIAAGHGPAILYRQREDRLETLEETQGMPLGIMEDAQIDAPLQLAFAPGDVLVLISDGFFEWQAASREQFGIERVCGSILASCREEPEAVLERLKRDVVAFTGGVPQADDTTALVIRCIA